MGRPASWVHWLGNTETGEPPFDRLLLSPLGLMFLPPYQNPNKLHDNTFLITLMEKGILWGTEVGGGVPSPIPSSSVMWWAYRDRRLGEYRLHTGLAGSCCRMGIPHLPFSLAPGSHGRKRASGNWRSHPPPLPPGSVALDKPFPALGLSYPK